MSRGVGEKLLVCTAAAAADDDDGDGAVCRRCLLSSSRCRRRRTSVNRPHMPPQPQPLKQRSRPHNTAAPPPH